MNKIFLDSSFKIPEFKELEIKGSIIQQQLNTVIQNAYDAYIEKLEAYIKSNIIQYYGEMTEDEFSIKNEGFGFNISIG